MKILVTGGAGFIGSHLCELLLDKGYEVVCVDNFNDFYDSKKKEQNIQDVKDNPRLNLYRADILDKEKLRDIFKKEQPDKVVHLAAWAGVRPSMERPNKYIDVNIKGTSNLLELSREFDIKQFIFGSSSSVYGVRDESGSFVETDDTDNVISVYGSTKKAGEVLCYTYAHNFDLPITCLRFFTVYGPRQRPDLAIHKFTRLLLGDEEITMYGDGSSMRDYTYVKDIANGIHKALQEEFDYEIINLGNNEPVKLLDLINLLSDVTGKEARIKEVEMPPGDVPVTYANIDKAKELLDWEPRVDFEEGIRKFVEWFKSKQRG